jgi:hypothetical protein
VAVLRWIGIGGTGLLRAMPGAFMVVRRDAIRQMTLFFP